MKTPFWDFAIRISVLVVVFNIAACFAQQSPTVEELRRRDEISSRQAKLLDQELRSKPPKVTVVLYFNDREIPNADFSVDFFGGPVRIIPLKIENGIYTFQRSHSEQSVLISYKSNNLFIEKPGLNLFEAGAIIVVNIFENKELLNRDIELRAPFLLNENFNKTSLYYHSRLQARNDYWPKMPKSVKDRAKRIVSTAIQSPLSSSGVLYAFSLEL